MYENKCLREILQGIFLVDLSIRQLFWEEKHLPVCSGYILAKIVTYYVAPLLCAYAYEVVTYKYLAIFKMCLLLCICMYHN